jgi:hypothetical protein
VTSFPGDEYRARLDQRRRAHTALTQMDARLSYARLALFFAGAVLAVAAWRGAFGAWWLVLPITAFGLLMQRHDKVIRARDAAARAISFYERGLARIEDRWTGTGESGDRFRDDGHLYANDLDLFGRGSLFELLSIARTRAGEEALASWLKAPADPVTVFSRQEAIEELRTRLDLRESLSLAGSELRASVDTDSLVGWATSAVSMGRRWLRGIAALLTAAAAGTGLAWVLGGNPAPFMVVVACEVLFFVPQRARVRKALHAADGPARDLDVLAHVLARLEVESFTSAALRSLHREVAGDRLGASIAIARLHRLVELHDWQHNQFFAPIAACLLWGTHLAWAIERWRAVHGPRVSAWLRAVGELEALSSLSAYRYEHPEDVFPTVLPLDPAVRDRGRFEGTALTHPLLASAQAVRNDVRLAGEVRLLIISGSNMSGKSTLLRTVGINTVLALAGAPVRAASLHLTPLAVGATLRIQDSLQEGRSRFFAEITRIRQLADAATGPVPVLFLLDELLQGTNSHDRLVGSIGVLKGLLGRGGIGLVTTHDLAVTAVAGDLAPRAINAHFEDVLEDGEMRFDYQLKPGPVTRSNAIALMRAIGLDVT